MGPSQLSPLQTGGLRFPTDPKLLWKFESRFSTPISAWLLEPRSHSASWVSRGQSLSKLVSVDGESPSHELRRDSWTHGNQKRWLAESRVAIDARGSMAMMQVYLQQIQPARSARPRPRSWNAPCSGASIPLLRSCQLNSIALSGAMGVPSRTDPL
jgi:hypothetical protein